MKALVTGATGFIGSHLVERLLEMGMSVTVLDDLSTGTIPGLVPKVTMGASALTSMWTSLS